jgi:hypothetical protein
MYEIGMIKPKWITWRRHVAGVEMIRYTARINRIPALMLSQKYGLANKQIVEVFCLFTL